VQPQTAHLKPMAVFSLSWTKFRLKQEWILLKEHWVLLLVSFLVQFTHSWFAALVYYLYNYYGVQYQETMTDLLFEVIAEDDWGNVADIIFWVCSILFALWQIHSIFFRSVKRTYFILMFRRFMVVLMFLMVGRIVSFLVTILPAPADHCKAGSEDYDPPTSVAEIFSSYTISAGCGDLIYSGHTIYMITYAMVYIRHGSWKLMKLLVWIPLFVMAYCLIAERRHYTVDIWLAVFIAPFVFQSSIVWFPDRISDQLIALERDVRLSADGSGVEFVGRDSESNSSSRV
jgi:hypothetical protein